MNYRRGSEPLVHADLENATTQLRRLFGDHARRVAIGGVRAAARIWRSCSGAAANCAAGIKNCIKILVLRRCDDLVDSNLRRPCFVDHVFGAQPKQNACLVD